MRGIIALCAMSAGFAVFTWGLYLIYQPLSILFAGGIVTLVGVGLAKQRREAAK